MALVRWALFGLKHTIAMKVGGMWDCEQSNGKGKSDEKGVQGKGKGPLLVKKDGFGHPTLKTTLKSKE